MTFRTQILKKKIWLKMFSYYTGYYVSPPVDQYLKFKTRCSLMYISPYFTNSLILLIIKSNAPIFKFNVNLL